ncbi:hypothetical protein OEZ86_011763 [Tetradesmus obliquus]|nr:hypothetical protein OEZ86_011763 [Tetradesmus obliquus]
MKWLRRGRPAGQVPPTPAPSLESASSLLGRSWSSMLPSSVLASLTAPAAAALAGLSRAGSSAAPDATSSADESAPTTPKGMLGSMLGGAGPSKAAAAAAAAAGRGTAVKAQPALPTIPSTHELAPAAAAAEAAPVPAHVLPKSRLSMPATAGALGGQADVAATALAGMQDTRSSRPAGVWSWRPLGSRTAGAAAAPEATSVMAPAPLYTMPAAYEHAAAVPAARGWWPLWGAGSGPEHTTQQWLSAAAAGPQAAPAAADASAAATQSECTAWQLASRLVGAAAAPVVWYWQAVGHTLSAGVDMASWLVEMAVWWALLPGRIAVWAALLPFRLELGLLRWLLPGWRTAGQAAEQRA